MNDELKNNSDLSIQHLLKAQPPRGSFWFIRLKTAN